MQQIHDLDIRLIRVFVAVVESGGFVGAQTRLNHAASTLSEQIKDLELRVGFTVCLRGRRGFKLTEQGEGLYVAAREVLMQLETFRNQVSRLSGRLAGVIKVGLVDNMITEPKLCMPLMINRFAAAKPDVQIHLTIAPPPELEASLLKGLLDIAIGPFPVAQKSLSYEPLYEERQTLYCGKGHPLFGRVEADVSEQDLQAAAFLACDYPSQANLTGLQSQARAKTIEALAMLLLSGSYIGFLPDHSARRWVTSGDLWPLCETTRSFDAVFSIATRQVAVEDPAHRAFVRMLRQDAEAPRQA
jgi:LysR family transcriptional regulator, transcriptional activator for bauABCD operon